MILRHAYSIVEEAKRAMAGQSKAVRDAIREETLRKIKKLCESNSKSQNPAKNPSA